MTATTQGNGNGHKPPAEIGAEDLVPSEGRLGQKRMRCPHPECPWWVPEGREHLADSHECIGPYYKSIDRSDLEPIDDVEKPEDYVSKFVEGNRVDFEALAADAIPRPRSERIRLLFGWDAFDYQRAILDDPNPDKSVNCGRQVGKTEAGGAIGADAVLFKAIPAGDDVAFFGDVQDTAGEMFRRCKDHLRRCPIPLEQLGVNRDNQTYWEFLETTRIYTGSLKNGGDNERGKLPKVVVVDEAALCQYSSFDEVVDPMFATHGDDHEMYVVSTPRGQTGYHYDAHQPDRRPDHFSVHAVPTWANPLVDEGWLEKKRTSTDSDTWRQEWLGEFIADGNAYIPASLYRPCQSDLETFDRDRGFLRVAGHPKPGVEYYGACDVAGAGDDRTVYIVMTGDGTVVHIENEETSRTPSVIGRIGDLNEEFDFVLFGVDQNSLGQGVVDFTQVDRSLSRAVEGVPFSLQQKSTMYKRLKKAFEGEELQLPKHGRLERETTRLQYEFTANRHVKVHAPESGSDDDSRGHDDHPDALALVNWVREDLNTGGSEISHSEHSFSDVF